MDSSRLYYKLNVIFILMLLLPAAGFLYFGNEYGYLHDKYVKYFVVVSLIYIFAGFHLLRKIFDSIVQLSNVVKEKIHHDIAEGVVDENQSELQQIIQSFNTLENQLRVNTDLLTRRTSEVSILKELSDICYVTLDPWEILYVTLERALLLSNADKGSVLILTGRTTNPLSLKPALDLAITLKWMIALILTPPLPSMPLSIKIL